MDIPAYNQSYEESGGTLLSWIGQVLQKAYVCRNQKEEPQLFLLKAFRAEHRFVIGRDFWFTSCTL